MASTRMDRNGTNAELRRRLGLAVELSSAEASAERTPGGASSLLVNRTHRIVRERAKSIRARRSLVRSLWLPLAVFSGLLIVLCTAVWSVLDQYELAPTGMPDASQQMLVLLMWCLPASAVLLAVVWFRRAGSAGAGSRPENGNTP